MDASKSTRGTVIALEVAYQDEENKMLLKPGQTNAFTASAVR